MVEQATLQHYCKLMADSGLFAGIRRRDWLGQLVGYDEDVVLTMIFLILTRLKIEGTAHSTSLFRP